MIIDCFTFFNELDLLEIRLEELDKLVDFFVLVEATKTQSLIDKPLYFEDNKQRYNKFLHKIIHVIVDDTINNEHNLWTMENFQRNCIVRGLQKISNLSTNDWIMISDLDEIPKRSTLEKELTTTEQTIFALDMIFSAYYYNLVASDRTWIGTVCLRAEMLQTYPPQYIRSIKDHIPNIKNAGWHLSWLGGYEKVYEKAHSCIEPFDKSQLPTKESFKQFFDDFLTDPNKYFIHIEDLSKKQTRFQRIVIDESFPEYIYQNQEELKEFIL